MENYKEEGEITESQNCLLTDTDKESSGSDSIESIDEKENTKTTSYTNMLVSNNNSMEPRSYKHVMYRRDKINMKKWNNNKMSLMLVVIKLISTLHKRLIKY